MREVQIAVLSGRARATQSKSAEAGVDNGSFLSVVCCGVPSRSSTIVENSGQARHPCAQSSIKHQRHCISDIIIAFCMMQ